jgi:hypothetical protein
MSGFVAKKVVSSLPATLEADTLYFVRVGDGFDMYLTNSIGLVTAYAVNQSSDPASINLSTDYSTTTPSAPANGVEVFARKLAERRRLAYIGPSGLSTEVQALIAGNKIGWWLAQGNGTVVSTFGMASSASTATARNVSDTNRFTMMRRIGYVATSTSVSVRHATLQFNRQAGFEYIARLGISALPSSGWFRLLVGLVSTTSGLAALGNGAAVGAGLYFSNSLPGSPTGISAVSCGTIANSQTIHTTVPTSDFPVNTANVDMYEVRLFCPPGGSIGWSVTRLTGGTGQVASGVMTTQLPAETTLLTPNIHLQTEVSGANAAMDVVSQYIETDL